MELIAELNPVGNISTGNETKLIERLTSSKQCHISASLKVGDWYYYQQDIISHLGKEAIMLEDLCRQPDLIQFQNYASFMHEYNKKQETRL